MGNNNETIIPLIQSNSPFGAIERKISFRYLRSKKNQGGVGLISLISFICIMLAIAAMIIIMSIMNGFRDEMINLTIGSEGHMFVASSNPDPNKQYIELLEKDLSSLSGIEGAFQFTQNFTGIQANSQFGLAKVIGIAPENLKDFALVVSNIIEGSIQESSSSLKQENMITIGSGLANSFGLKVGDSIVIYSPNSRQTISGPMPIKKSYTVGAIFKSGLYQADLSNIYMDINQTSLLFNKGLHSGEIQIRLSNPDELDKIRNEILNIIDEPVFIQSWKDRNASTATALRTEQIAMRFIFMVVVIIAVFPVLASMIMLVKNKSKDIAVLRTLGVSRAAILRIFFITGVSIGSVGTFSGVLLGILFCSNVEHIQSVLEFITGVELFPEDVYQLSGGIPSKVIWVEVFGVAFWGFLISALATFFPALTASRIDPVDALRYD
ncbi:MAG: FtsX-like permease family protein [Rhodospirillaceae bacterium]|jgi:lipoprotein-releasing system permease protein|nr:FtsX-like permease family protein [Rhodospirillaceae bacterium]